MLSIFFKASFNSNSASLGRPVLYSRFNDDNDDDEEEEEEEEEEERGGGGKLSFHVDKKEDRTNRRKQKSKSL